MPVVRDVGVEVGQTGYRIRQGTAYSEEADFGDPIEWRAPNSKLYIALVEEGAGGAEVETPFEHFVYECKPVADAEIEDVDLPGDEDAVVMDEGDEGDDDDNDEGDQEPENGEDEPEPTE